MSPPRRSRFSDQAVETNWDGFTTVEASLPHLFPRVAASAPPQSSGVVGTRLIQATPKPSPRDTPLQTPTPATPLTRPKSRPWTHLCRPGLRHRPLWKTRSVSARLCPSLNGCISQSLFPTLHFCLCVSLLYSPSLSVSVSLQSSACPCLSEFLGLSLQISVYVSLSLSAPLSPSLDVLSL